MLEICRNAALPGLNQWLIKTMGVVKMMVVNILEVVRFLVMNIMVVKMVEMKKRVVNMLVVKILWWC